MYIYITIEGFSHSLATVSKSPACVNSFECSCSDPHTYGVKVVTSLDNLYQFPFGLLTQLLYFGLNPTVITGLPSACLQPR